MSVKSSASGNPNREASNYSLYLNSRIKKAGAALGVASLVSLGAYLYWKGSPQEVSHSSGTLPSKDNLEVNLFFDGALKAIGATAGAFACLYSAYSGIKNSSSKIYSLWAAATVVLPTLFALKDSLFAKK